MVDSTILLGCSVVVLAVAYSQLGSFGVVLVFVQVAALFIAYKLGNGVYARDARASTTPQEEAPIHQPNRPRRKKKEEKNKEEEKEEKSTATVTASSNPFNVVTSVKHTSGWDPHQGKALLCIGTLEYSKTTTKDQNDLYLMKTVPTGSDCADLHDEFMVTFIDKEMTKDNAEEAYQKISEQKRVIKHVRAGGKMLETRMNGDVTRNFRIKGGFCQHDGLHVIVPRKDLVTKKESFRDGQSLTIKKLFQKMRALGCDYL